MFIVNLSYTVIIMKEKDSKKKDDKIDNDYIFSKDNINILNQKIFLKFF